VYTDILIAYKESISRASLRALLAKIIHPRRRRQTTVTDEELIILPPETVAGATAAF